MQRNLFRGLKSDLVIVMMGTRGNVKNREDINRCCNLHRYDHLGVNVRLY